MNAVHLVKVSTNSKTGPIPVSTSSAETCPTSCPLKGSGCYAEMGNLAIHWRKVTKGERGMEFNDFLLEVKKLPEGTLWRHNQAGDLQGEGNKIDSKKLKDLVAANEGRKGFAYTHYPLSPENLNDLSFANKNGLTINLSCNNLIDVDANFEKAQKAGIPLVTVLPATKEGDKETRFTPKGRKVIVCPATYRENTTCQSCGLCQKSSRSVVVGFPAHGSRKAKVSEVFLNFR